METPQAWVVLEVHNGTETLQKVFAGWRGSYLSGESWKLNSGIKEIKETDTHWEFTGYSGNVYNCNKSYYGMTIYMVDVLNAWTKQLPSDCYMKVVESYNPKEENDKKD